MRGKNCMWILGGIIMRRLLMPEQGAGDPARLDELLELCGKASGSGVSGKHDLSQGIEPSENFRRISGDSKAGSGSGRKMEIMAADCAG